MRKYDLTINGRSYRVHVQNFSPEEATLRIKGKTYTVKVKDIVDSGSGERRKITTDVSRPAPSPFAGSARPATADGGEKKVKAPIPGEILDVFVKEGDHVNPDKVVLKMEAMKMENNIKAGMEGTVQSILIKPGDAVGEGQDLIILE